MLKLKPKSGAVVNPIAVNDSPVVAADASPAPEAVMSPGNDNSADEKFTAQSEVLQPEGSIIESGEAAEDLPDIMDEGSSTLNETDPLIEKEQAPGDPVQSDEAISATMNELDHLPGIVDEEPVGPDDDDDLGRHVELTEDFIANAFVEQYGRDIRFDHTRDCWYVWSGAYWAKDETGWVFDMARRFSRELRGGNTRMASKKAVEGVEVMARRDRRVAVTSDVWDHDPFVLGTPDGYVDLCTGDLMRPDRELMVSKVTSVAPADEGVAAPHFATFIDQVTNGDAALKRFLRQFLGYCLTGSTSEQVLLFIYGPGGNGKGKLQSAVCQIMGDYSKTAAMDTFTASKHQRHLTEVAMLDGARLVGASETEKGQKWSQARVNQLTGGDAVTANYMRQDMFTFIPKFKLLVVGNHKPQLGTVNEAARRRFLIVPFLYKPDQPDKMLGAKLGAEYPAILRWMIDGCLDWQEHGLVLPDIVKQATNAYFEDEDVFGRWISEKCQCAPGLKSKAIALYESWREFAEANGEDPGSMKAMAEQLAQRGFKKIKSDGVKYLGIGLLPISTQNFGNEM